MQRVLHETCRQYVARRLSEGWKIVRQQGYHLILSSPDGTILRPVDLRHDTLTLRPNGAGSSQQWDTNDHTLVDEAVPDEDTTYIKDAYNGGVSYNSSYAFPDHTTEAGTINSVKVYARCRGTHAAGGAGIFYVIIVVGGVLKGLGGPKTLTNAYQDTSYTWATNPDTASAWTWTDIDNLDAGVRGYENTAAKEIRCTQIYVEVDYSPAAGRSFGFIMG